MAYRADIEIGVKGARSLEQLRSSINLTARAVDSLNDVVGARGGLVQSIQNYTNNLNRAAQSLARVGAGTEAETKAVREYVQALGEANAARARQNSLVAQELANQRRVTPGNAGYGQQGPALPPALVQAQKVQQSWNRFFQEATEVAQELQASTAAKTTNIKSSWNRFFQEATEVAQELQASTAAKALNIRASWNTFFIEAQNLAAQLTADIRRTEGSASAAAKQRLAQDAARRGRIQNAGFGLQGPALPPTAPTGRGAAGRGGGGGGGGGRLGGAISGSIIGGAFPLLFGQGGGAAAGGAIGGLVGGLAGPGGSFAGSLLGTLLGDIAGRGQVVKQLGEDLGFSATQAKTLADAFKVANTDVEKFTAVIQNIRGVGLELEEQATAVQLITALTEKYGGSFEKVGNAITSVLESGKVNQAALNQLTSQGITVQDALANKYDVSRDKILEMTKKGQISVQDLLDTLVDLGNESTTAAKKVQSPFEQAISTTVQLYQGFYRDVVAIFAGIGSNGSSAAETLVRAFNKLLQEVIFPLFRFLTRIVALLVDVAATGVNAAAELIRGFRGVSNAIADALIGIVNMIPGLRTLVNLARQLFKGATGPAQATDKVKPAVKGKIGRITAPSQAAPTGGGAGSKPPEDRTARLQDDLKAMQLISITQDGIRDALFEGNLELAARLAYDQKIADINRDTFKALREANYETEKAAILGQQAVRIKDAQLEQEDKLREIQNQEFQDRLRAQEAVRQAIKPFTDLTQQQELQTQYTKTYLRLVTEGMLPAEAERIANFEKLVKQQLFAVEEQIKITELAIIEAKARGASTAELEKQLKVYKDQQDAIKGEASKGPGPAKTDRERLQDEIAAVQGQLNTLIDPINLVTTAAEGIGTAFSNSFKGIVSGTMTAQEALANFFQNVADQFLDMAAQIIAKWIQMTILNSVLSLFPGSSAGTKTDSVGQFNAAVLQYRANGGPVSAGSPYIVGERGPELFVPRRSGTIVPNDQMGGSKVEVGSINISVENTGESLSAQAQKQIANQVQGIVMATLVNERRSGGVLR